MILATHALAGAAAAAIFRKHPLIAVAAAFLSHFLLDAVPHWQYKLDSLKKDESKPFKEYFVFDMRFFNDVLKTGLDFSIGLFISLLISEVYFPKYFWLTFFGAAAGALPDLLQVAYHLFPDSPLFYLQKFHNAMHTRKSNDSFIRGNIYQIGFSLAIILILIFTKSLF